MKTKHESIERICALCVHATPTPVAETDAPPPLLLRLSSDTRDEEKTRLSCPYKKDICAHTHCFRFRFDPLKYKPSAPPQMPVLDTESVLTDP